MKLGTADIMINKLCCLLLMFALPTISMAQDKSVGTVVRALGEVQLLASHGQQRQLRTQDRVAPGDTLITGEDAWLTVNFYDLTRVVLRPNSRFKIERFPRTLDEGDIKLQLFSGAARVSSGTIASQSLERFSLLTPNGLIQAGRAEWVVRLCEGQDCQRLSEEIRSCGRYEKPNSLNQQFVSVYKGEIAPAYCEAQTRIRLGQSAMSQLQSNSCTVIPEVPCFILFDKKLGRDKARALEKNLTLLPGQEASVQRPPPRRERPAKRGEHRRPPPGGRAPPRRPPRR